MTSVKLDIADRQSLIFRIFSKNPYFNIETIKKVLEDKYKVFTSTSTIQRDLSVFNKEIVEVDGEEVTVLEQKKRIKEMGNIQGGINSYQNNIHIKDEEGKFIGSKVDTNGIDKEEVKKQDIIRAVIFYEKHPNHTLSMIARELSKQENKEYTYDLYDIKIKGKISDIKGIYLIAYILLREIPYHHEI